MKKNLRNKTGYTTLKLRLLIVLIILGGIGFFGYNVWMKSHDISIIVISGLMVISFITVFMFSPIKTRHNGFEQSV